MWSGALTLPFPLSPLPFSANLNCKSQKRVNFTLRASLSDYPLASRIFVTNLPYSTKESSLQKEFANFGQIAEVKLVKDGFTKRSKGYAFIQYTSQDDAMLAIENMDQQEFDGRVIYVEIAKPGKDRFREYLKASGPPIGKQPLQETNDEAEPSGNLQETNDEAEPSGPPIGKQNLQETNDESEPSGLPNGKQYLQETNDEADCWY